jgi:uncharacterized protein
VHTDLSFYLFAVPAVIMMGLAKGGFAGLGMTATALLASIVPPLQAVAILAPILMVQDIVTVYAYRREWDARNLKILLPGGVAGVGIAYVLASRAPDAAIMLIIGGLSLFFSLRRMFARAALQRSDALPKVLPGVLCGVASGFGSMIANAGAPTFQIYVMPQRLPPAIYVGTSVMFFAVTNWIKVIPYALLGQMGRENLLTSLVLLPLAIVSTWLGIWLIRRMSSAKFYPVLNGLLFLVGLRLAWTGLRGYGLF